MVSVHAEVFSETDWKALRACSERSYRYVDDMVNNKYRTLLGKSDVNTKKLLVVTEKKWIAYRDRRCDIELNSGAEAELDKLGCLIKLTKLRSDELEFLATGTGMFGFSSHLNLEAKNHSLNRQAVIEKLASRFSASNDALWSNYVIQNCKLTSKLISEELDRCVARLTFYADYG